ncbi:MAG: hypothetical protein ABR865_12725 [Terracidiphilus sp.]|jgi:hypothetical protein
MNRRVGSPAKYRFEDRFLFFIVPLFVLDGVLGFWGFHYHHLHPAGALAVVCAALQSSPIIAFIVIIALYLAEENDEFQKSILVQSMLWAIGVTLAVATFCGSMEKYSQGPRVDIASVQFLFFIVMIIAIGANRWRYR